MTTPHGAEKLAAQGFRALTALDTWQSTMMERAGGVLRVTAMPGVHGPGLARRLLPPVMGSLLEFQDGDARAFTMYVTGDTLMHDGIADIARRHPEIDLALVHLGGTRIAGLLLTMDAAQGVELLRTVGPRVAIPIHYDDYTVFRSPLSDFVDAVGRAGLRDRRPVSQPRAALPVRPPGLRPAARRLSARGSGRRQRRLQRDLDVPGEGLRHRTVQFGVSGTKTSIHHHAATAWYSWISPPRTGRHLTSGTRSTEATGSG